MKIEYLLFPQHTLDRIFEVSIGSLAMAEPYWKNPTAPEQRDTNLPPRYVNLPPENDVNQISTLPTYNEATRPTSQPTRLDEYI